MRFDIIIRSVNIIMNIFLKRICILALFALLMVSAIGCSSDSEAGSDGVNGQLSEDSALTSDVRKFFDELYLCFNEHRFEEYLTYLNVTDDTMRANMLGSFNNATQYYETVCEIEDIAVRQFDDGLINVALSLINTSKTIGDEESAPVKIREIIYYNLEANGDSFTVKNFTSGGSQLITEEK